MFHIVASWVRRQWSAFFAPFIVRIPALPEFDFERSALQLERFPEKTFQIAAIAVRNLVKRSAMDHDARRIAAALVRVAQLGTEHPAARRRLARDGGDQCPCQLRGRPVSYTHLRAHETRHDIVCRLLLE